jgi:murein DD-endopeptidase MepM/ murein hydrolase activator NlpD
MSDEQNIRTKLLTRLRNRYRLTIMNDDTFEEKFTLRLTPLGVVILIGSVTIIFTIIVISMLAFTSLREYIPGYADVGVRRDMIKLALKSDSLEQTITEQNFFIQNLDNVLQGNIKNDSAQSRPNKKPAPPNLKIGASPKEKDLRKTIEAQDQYALSFATETNKTGISNFFFFTPLKGRITSSFKASEQHFGVDIVAAENEPIKSTLDGTVILATFSTETGYTITVQHSNNLISVYKHNSVLLKKPGDYVKAGDPIAIIGNSGEQTSGPHLHFELWYNGNAINPQDYMVF